MKYKILYINHPLSAISGAPISLLALLRNLNKEVFEPLVALPDSGHLFKLVSQLGVETVVIPQQKLKAKNPFPYLKTVFSLVSLVRKRHVNLIHSNMDIGNQYGVPAAKLTGIPIVCHTRNILGKRPFQRMFLNYSDVLIANSNAVAASYSKYVSRLQKIKVIYNGADLNEFSPSSTRRGMFRTRLGISEDAFIIGNIARICPEKGQHYLIDAMSEVTKKHSEVYAVIAGDTVIDDSAAFLMSLKKRVLEYGLTDKVIFIGFVENIIDLYADLDLVVLPSLCEPFGRVLIEAMSMEIPVIANRSGGPMEIVEDGQSGFLVDTSNTKTFADAIIRLLNDQPLCKKMGKRGREIVEKKFSIQTNVRNIESVYKSLLD